MHEDDECFKVMYRVQGPSAEEKMCISDLQFDGDRPRAVLAWIRGSRKPALWIALDAGKLKRIGPNDSRTFRYDGVIPLSPEHA